MVRLTLTFDVRFNLNPNFMNVCFLQQSKYNRQSEYKDHFWLRGEIVLFFKA